MYETIVIKYSPKSKKMAKKLKDKSNEMAEKGYKLITVTVTGTGKAILVFSGKSCTESEEKPNEQV